MTMSDFNHGWHSSLHEKLSNPKVLKCFTKWQSNKGLQVISSWPQIPWYRQLTFCTV